MTEAPTLTLTDVVRSLSDPNNDGRCSVTFSCDPAYYYVQKSQKDLLSTLKTSLDKKRPTTIRFNAVDLSILSAGDGIT